MSQKNNITAFQSKCYDLLEKVPAGKVTTYQDLAHAMGNRAYRAVGTAMNKNPFAPQVPCHRVVSSDGSLGGYAYGSDKKKKILQEEGIEFDGDRVVAFEEKKFQF